MTNHTWRQCRWEAVISTVGQMKPFQTQKRAFSGFRTNRPQVSRTLRIQNQVSQQINQIVRPKSWETDMDASQIHVQAPLATASGYAGLIEPGIQISLKQDTLILTLRPVLLKKRDKFRLKVRNGSGIWL